MIYNNAFLIGKFLPPHIGHLSMIKFAGSFSKKVTVVVEQQENEPIDVDLRVNWLKQSLDQEQFNIVPLYGIQPSSPPQDKAGAEKFWLYWKNIIKNLCPNIDVLISADDYGKKLASDQNVPWLPFDRNTFPISATFFKEKPWNRFDLLIPPAKEYLLKNIVVLGAESTGKSTMTMNLAQMGKEKTIFVPEYAEHWIKRNQELPIDDKALINFLYGQKSSCDGLRSVANRWICEDSNALTTAIWANYLGFNDVAEIAFKEAEKLKPSLVIMASINGAEWINDKHRFKGIDLNYFENQFLLHLDRLGWEYKIVDGDWGNRNKQASALRERFLYHWQEANWAEWSNTQPNIRKFKI